MSFFSLASLIECQAKIYPVSFLVSVIVGSKLFFFSLFEVFGSFRAWETEVPQRFGTCSTLLLPSITFEVKPEGFTINSSPLLVSSIFTFIVLHPDLSFCSKGLALDGTSLFGVCTGLLACLSVVPNLS